MDFGGAGRSAAGLLAALATATAAGLAFGAGAEEPAAVDPGVEIVAVAIREPVPEPPEDSAAAEPSGEEGAATPELPAIYDLETLHPGLREWRRGGIAVHRMAEPRGPSRLVEHRWDPGAPSRIRSHDWRAAAPSRIPYGRMNRNIVEHRWRPNAPSRIRHHSWTTGAAYGR